MSFALSRESKTQHRGLHPLAGDRREQWYPIPPELSGGRRDEVVAGSRSSLSHLPGVFADQPGTAREMGSDRRNQA